MSQYPELIIRSNGKLNLHFFLLCYCRTRMRMKEALMSGAVLQALQDLEKIPGQCNYLGNLHMKYELWLIKILFR